MRGDEREPGPPPPLRGARRGGARGAGAAVDFASEYAAGRAADVDLVHTWQPDVDLSGFSVLVDSEPAAAIAEELLAAVPEAQVREGIEVRRTAAPGGAAPVLLQAAAGADLLVVGARRRHGQLGLQLGPVNHAVLHHAPCPVAVVPTF